MKSPETKILERAVLVLTEGNIHQLIGQATPFMVRHMRNRHANQQERPGIGVGFGSVEPDADRQGYTTNEDCWKLELDIVVDLKLASEASNNDPSGFDKLTLAAAHAAKILCNPEGGMRALVDDVIDGGCAPDEDSTESDGRLVQAISVLYRTPQGDRTVLLSPEENL